MKQGKTKLSALTRLFSSAVYQELARKGSSALFRRLVESTDLACGNKSNGTVADTFDAAFDILKAIGSRDEYIYRSALTRNILLGTHSLRTASMLSEFRVGKCRADLVILNGTATVYEIKSERDSLTRLSKQIESYRRAFAKIYVIASECQIDEVSSVVPEEVGIMCLSSRFHIARRREAIERFDNICALTIFESIQTSEARAILKSLDVAIPDVPNTRLRSLMRASFAELEPARVHDVMVRTLKRTRNLAPLCGLVEQLPKSLHAAALSTPIRRRDHERLAEVLRMPLASTTAWS